MSLPANFPTSLDALANPTATTNRDDLGFELDLVVSRIHDILEALEAKVGITASLPSAAGGALRQTGAGLSAWGAIATVDLAPNVVGKRQLDYHAGDLHNGTAFTAGVWNEILLTPFYITFPVSQSDSTVLISASGQFVAYGGTNNLTINTRLILDATGTGGPQAQQILYLGGWPGAIVYVNPMSGSGTHVLTNLVAGTHTLKIQMLSSSFNAQVYLQGASAPTTHYLTVQIVEIQR